MRIFLRDGLSLWPGARRLDKGGVVWPRGKAPQLQLCEEQWTVLSVGCLDDTTAIQATIEHFSNDRQEIGMCDAPGRRLVEQTFSVDCILDRFETRYTGMV